MMNYKHIFKQKAVWEIQSFYMHVAEKYRHTYSYEDMERNMHQAFTAGYMIERTLMRRKPTLSRWRDYHMAHYGKWYYAYIIEKDIINIVDACHEQNLH